MKKKNVQFVDLMEHYSKRMGHGAFTYPNEWAGFNLPGTYVFKRHQEGISDPNRYDELMHSLACYIRSKEGSEDFYMIGTSDDDEWKNVTFNHELAHALFYSDSLYKAKMNKYVRELPDNIRSKIFSILKKWGYDDEALIDETQAYMSTGLQEKLDVVSIREHQPRFKRLFNSYSKGMRKRPEKGFQKPIRTPIAAKKNKK